VVEARLCPGANCSSKVAGCGVRAGMSHPKILISECEPFSSKEIKKDFIFLNLK
jgi:hypothetical protein